MTESAIVYTDLEDSVAAAKDLSEKLAAALPGGPPHALIVFASPRYDHAALLETLAASCRPAVLVGASSAGEFTSSARGEGLACALALRSETLKFAGAIGYHLISDRAAAARAMVRSFTGLTDAERPFRAALVMTDALAGHADELVDELTLATAGSYQFFGGGAGDNGEFRRTPVFFGTDAVIDAAVALEIVSTKPIGIGVGHGWKPASPPMRVTEARGSRLVSLNGVPAVQAFVKHALATTQTFEPSSPMPFFLHNILGIDTGGGYRLRVPLAITPDGSIACAADIPTGVLVHIMRATESSAIEAAARAVAGARAGLQGHRAEVALFFDCVATRLRLGVGFGAELQTLTDTLGGTSFVGCNTHGQIARAEGQFGGFHNCTAVVCILPD